ASAPAPPIPIISLRVRPPDASPVITTPRSSNGTYDPNVVLSWGDVVRFARRDVDLDRRSRRRRDRADPPDPTRRCVRTGRVPRTSVAREPVPALLLAQTTPRRRPAGAIHRCRHGRSGRVRRRTARRVRRLGELRAAATAPRRRGRLPC